MGNDPQLGGLRLLSDHFLLLNCNKPQQMHTIQNLEINFKSQLAENSREHNRMETAANYMQGVITNFKGRISNFKKLQKISYFP